jgi:hypothetical protein
MGEIMGKMTILIIPFILFALTRAPAADKDTLVIGLAADAMSLDRHKMIRA